MDWSFCLQAVSLAVVAVDDKNKDAFGSRGEKTTARFCEADKRETSALSPLRLFPMVALLCFALLCRVATVFGRAQCRKFCLLEPSIEQRRSLGVVGNLNMCRWHDWRGVRKRTRSFWFGSLVKPEQTKINKRIQPGQARPDHDDACTLGWTFILSDTKLAPFIAARHTHCG